MREVYLRHQHAAEAAPWLWVLLGVAALALFVAPLVREHLAVLRRQRATCAAHEARRHRGGELERVYRRDDLAEFAWPNAAELDQPAPVGSTTEGRRAA